MKYNLKSVNRGSSPKDNIWFSSEAVLKLQKAQKELLWLLNRDYNIHSVIELVGNHYQFSTRQRNALQRATSPKTKCRNRLLKCLHPVSASKDCLYLDGFNLIITLEVAISRGIILLCNDGTIRDIAGLRGTYKIIDKTDAVLNIIGKEFSNLSVPKAKFFLDSAVSNSGRLGAFILEHSKEWNIPVEVELSSKVDSILSKMPRIVTSDSIILDSCTSWFNIAKKIIDDYIPSAHIINLTSY